MRNADLAVFITYHRLPDLSSYRDLKRYPELIHYGRFALLRDGSVWFSESPQSSHPADTKAGYYWAINQEGKVLVSARGAQTDLDLFLDDEGPLLDKLVKELLSRRWISWQPVSHHS